jgi:hypothetical protein
VVVHFIVPTCPNPEINPEDTPYIQSKYTKIQRANQVDCITFFNDSLFV